MFISLLVAETMTIHKITGEIVEFNISEINEITFEGNDSVEEMIQVLSKMPIKFMKNYPNPFNPETTIQFELNESGKTEVDIFNV